jgi:hypothetical protein
MKEKPTLKAIMRIERDVGRFRRLVLCLVMIL